MTDRGIMTNRRKAFVWCEKKNHVILVSIEYNIFHFGLRIVSR